jgi:hypothetical protein
MGKHLVLAETNDGWIIKPPPEQRGNIVLCELLGEACRSHNLESQGSNKWLIPEGIPIQRTATDLGVLVSQKLYEHRKLTTRFFLEN